MEEIYLVTFSIRISSDIEKDYKRVIEILKGHDKNSLQLNKSTFLFKDRAGVPTLFDQTITDKLEKEKIDAKVIIVKVIGWQFWALDEKDNTNIKTIEWLKSVK